jgi:hypothetical protein
MVGSMGKVHALQKKLIFLLRTKNEQKNVK